MLPVTPFLAAEKSELVCGLCRALRDPVSHEPVFQGQTPWVTRV